jgi:hypothetical protein
MDGAHCRGGLMLKVGQHVRVGVQGDLHSLTLVEKSERGRPIEKPHTLTLERVE